MRLTVDCAAAACTAHGVCSWAQSGRNNWSRMMDKFLRVQDMASDAMLLFR